MPNFIDRLNEQLSQEHKQAELRHTLTDRAAPHEQALRELMRTHWHPLPKLQRTERRPAFAVDGSRAVRHLANGAYLFVAQALLMGEGLEETEVDVRILPGATDSAVVERFAGLMMHQLEVRLAARFATQMPVGSVMFLDGALYGQLSSLYPIEMPSNGEALPNYVVDLPQAIVALYADLFQVCRTRQLVLISIAKTSHERAHGEAWWRAAYADAPMPREISDSEMIYRWTEKQAGCSTPILFGKKAVFRGGGRELRENLMAAPAIVSFFVRMEEFDDALRIDVPASAIHRSETIGDVQEPRLMEVACIEPVLELVAADYGGLEVYNALLYSVDREVRLRQEVMDEVYLSMIQNALGNDVEIRLDRSEHRFHTV
jgi:hypothetical protein